MQAITIQDAQKQLEFYKRISEIRPKLYLPGIESNFSSDKLPKFQSDREEFSKYVDRVAINILSVIVTKLDENRAEFETGIQSLEKKLQDLNDTVAFLDLLGDILVVIGKIVTVVV